MKFGLSLQSPAGNSVELLGIAILFLIESETCMGRLAIFDAMNHDALRS